MNSFKYTRSTADVVKKLCKHNGVERTQEDIEELFQYHHRVYFFSNFDKTDALLEDRTDILILKPDYEVDGDLQQNIDLNGY